MGLRYQKCIITLSKMEKNIFCHRLRNYSKRRRNIWVLQCTKMLLSLKLDHSTALYVNPKAVFVPISN